MPPVIQQGAKLCGTTEGDVVATTHNRSQQSDFIQRPFVKRPESNEGDGHLRPLHLDDARCQAEPLLFVSSEAKRVEEPPAQDPSSISDPVSDPSLPAPIAWYNHQFEHYIG